MHLIILHAMRTRNHISACNPSAPRSVRKHFGRAAWDGALVGGDALCLAFAPSSWLRWVPRAVVEAGRKAESQGKEQSSRRIAHRVTSAHRVGPIWGAGKLSAHVGRKEQI